MAKQHFGQAIIWTSDNQGQWWFPNLNLLCYMASLGHNDLNDLSISWYSYYTSLSEASQLIEVPQIKPNFLKYFCLHQKHLIHP